MTKNHELICITLGLDILLITIVLTQSLNIFDRTILYYSDDSLLGGRPEMSFW